MLERTRAHSEYANEYTRLFEGEGAAWRRARPGTPSRLALGLDCEMVYAKNDPNGLARVSLVSFTGLVLDAYVQRSPGDILDYRTYISGVDPHHLLAENGALPFESIQDQVLDFISPDTILVGHALQNDLRALRMRHDKIVDTALLFGVAGGNHRQKHKLHSLVSLMRPKVATLQSARADAAHDSRQDATWALQIALYEASIHPRRTQPLRVETFPTKIFLSEIQKGTVNNDLQALFRGGDVSDVCYQLQGAPPGTWLGHATAKFPSRSHRDAAFAALARFVSVHVGPMRDWAHRADVTKMQAELTEHLLRFGRVRSCRVFRPRGHGQSAYPFAFLDCHPATARALLTAEVHSFDKHRTRFKVQLAEEEPGKRRCVVPLGSGHFIAKLQ